MTPNFVSLKNRLEGKSDMDKEQKAKELEKRLEKFAVDGQKKLVNQLRQMIQAETGQRIPENTDIRKKSVSSRDDLFRLMDSMQEQTREQFVFGTAENPVFLECLMIPSAGSLPDIPDDYKTAFDEIQIINKQFLIDRFVFYSRNITKESGSGQPHIFDPKVQAVIIAEMLTEIGRFYRGLNLAPTATIAVAFRYSDAGHLAVGSISPETFLPTSPYGDTDLTLYISRRLHELVNDVVEITADIIIELLKRLKYQGIVNRDFFIHAIIKSRKEKRKDS